MSITRLPKAKTPTGRAVQRVVRGVRPRTPVGKIAVALTAEIGGALGDGAHKVFAGGGSGSSGSGAAAAGWTDVYRLREERVRRYAAEALRQQQEAGRRAEEAYHRARDEGQGKQEDEPQRAGAHEERGYRYGGKVVADYYEVLEVSPKARQSVIEKAYRALMREDHPDQGGDTARAQLLNEAYQVLHDPVERRKYDEQNNVR
jgi:hypothetical protein